MKKFVKLLALVCCLVLGVALTLTGCGAPEPQSTTFTLTLDYSKALFADVDRWNFGPKSDNHIVSNTFDEENLATKFSFDSFGWRCSCLSKSFAMIALLA